MPTDVIIDPSNGQIYWNDGTGSPQSISLGGNAQDTISVTGYGAVYTPGSAVGGTTVLVRFKDSALETLAPGTNGYELGSSTLRWKLFATTGNFSDSTNSTSLTSGAFQIQGGIAVSGNASFGQTVLFWTPGGVNYIGFRAPASAGNTTYVLPSAAPISGATGTSVLSSDQSGILSWIPIATSSSSGLATTAQNVQVGLVGNSNTFHSILLTPTISAAGSAVSGNGTLNYNTQTDILSTPGLAVTSSINAASTTSGAFQVKGGVGITGNAFIGGTINVATPLSIPNGGTNVSSFGQTGGFVYYDGANIRLLAATGASINFTNGYYQFDNRVYASSFFANNAQMPNGSGVGGRVTIWSGNNTIGSDADFTYDSTNNILTVLGNINGIGFTASGVAVTSTTASTSTTTGALVVTGGAGIGQSLYVGGMIRVGTNTFAKSNSLGDVSLDNGSPTDTPGVTYYWGNNLNFGTDVLSEGVGSTRYRVVYNLNETGGREVFTIDTNGNVRLYNVAGTQFFGMRYSGSASTTYTLPANSPQSAAGTSVLSSTVDGVMSWVPLSASSNPTASFATTSGNVQVQLIGNPDTQHPLLLTRTISSAGSAVSGNGTLVYNPFTDILTTPGLAVTSATSATSTTTGSLRVFGGVGITGNAFIGGTINAAGVTLIANSTSATSTGTGSLVNVGGFGNAGNVFIGGTINAAGITLISNSTSSTSTATGSLVNVGGFGLQGNAFIGGSSYQSGAAIFANSNTSISTTTGALIVTGGVGIGGSLYVTNTVPSGISGLYVFNGVLSGTALTAPSVTTTNIRTTASTLSIVDTGTSSTVLSYNGSRFAVLIDANSTASNNGGFQVTGGAGFGASINVNGNISARAGYELRVYNPGDTAYTGFDFTGSASTTYILPLTSPATGSSVLQSTAGGVMSWVPMTAGGGGAPGGAIGDIQLNSGASSFTTLNSSYLNVSTTTGMMKHIGYNVSGTSNSATVNAFLLGSDGSGTFSGQSRGTLLALDNTSGNGITYNFIDAQYYDGTPSQKSVFKVDYLGRVVHADLTITGSNYSGTRFHNTLKTSTSQATNVVYTLPLAAPGAGQTFLTADTAGNMYWVATPTGGSGTPGGSNRQIQYNNATAFGGATGFEYVSAGSAVTVSYFSAAGGGNTVGMVICAVNATTTRVGIGLTNPAFELEIRGEISATNKSFVIDHPTKPGMKLRYGSLEGPENGVYVRGQLLGTNIIETPDYWRGLVHDDSYTIHLTPNGNYQQLYVDKIQDYKVYVGTASTFEINCFYSIWAERKDISKLKVEY